MSTNQVKIYLPAIFPKFPKLFLFGYFIQTESCAKFFIVKLSTSKALLTQSSAVLLGELTLKSERDQLPAINSKNAENYISLKKTEEKFEILETVMDKKITSQSIYYQIINYDVDKFLRLAPNNYDSENDFLLLSKFIKKAELPKKVKKEGCNFILSRFLVFINLLEVVLKPISLIFAKTAVYRHFVVWRKCSKMNSFKDGSSWTTVLDIVAGVSILTWLLFAEHPGTYLMELTEVILFLLHLFKCM